MSSEIIAHLHFSGEEIVSLTEIVKNTSRTPQSATNAAKRQSLSAFRERGHWKVGRRTFVEWEKQQR